MAYPPANLARVRVDAVARNDVRVSCRVVVVPFLGLRQEIRFAFEKVHVDVVLDDAEVRGVVECIRPSRSSEPARAQETVFNFIGLSNMKSKHFGRANHLESR